MVPLKRNARHKKKPAILKREKKFEFRAVVFMSISFGFCVILPRKNEPQNKKKYQANRLDPLYPGISGQNAFCPNPRGHILLQWEVCDLQPGELVAFLVALGLMNGPLKQLSEVNALTQRALAGAERVFEVLDPREGGLI